MYYATRHSFINHGCLVCFARAPCKRVLNLSSLMMLACLGLIQLADVYGPSWGIVEVLTLEFAVDPPIQYLS